MLMIGAIAGYMAALELLAVSSPGAGPIGWLMLVLPGEFMEWMHAPAYGFLAWLTLIWLRRRSWPWPYAVPVGLSLALVFGLWTEVAQVSVPGREPSVKDLVVDGVGIVAAAMWIWWREMGPPAGRGAAAWCWLGLQRNGIGT